MERPNSKFGIYGFAYITNSSSFIDELNAIIYNDNAEFQRFNKYFHTNVTLGNNIVFLDKFGNKKDRQNNTVIKSNAFYAIYDTGFKLANANIIYGIFSRKTLLNTFEGIEFGDDRKLKEIIQERLRFEIGLIHFDYDDHSWEDGFDFIEDLYSTAIPENWSYYKQSSSIPHPILKSYIEYILLALPKKKMDLN